MTLRDCTVISFGNLHRMKLRTFLTTAGILIAIAAFVAMLSFGAGNQEYIEGEFTKLGLFSTMQVYPRNRELRGDSANAPKLDRAALERIAAVPGVNLVYPFDAFTVSVRLGDSLISSKAQALPLAAMKTKLYSEMKAGAAFDSNNAREVIISEELLKKAGIGRADSALGRSLILSVHVSVVDSGLSHILVDRGESIIDRVRRIKVDSLLNRRYRSRLIRNEANEAMRRFLNGFLTAKQEVTDTLTIVGVRASGRMGQLRTEALIIPVATAARFNAAGMGGSPTEIFAAMSSGTLFTHPEDGGKTYPQVTVDFDPKVYYKSIRDSVEAMGYRTFSFAEQFERLQQAFLYFDLALGVIGLIALFTASLGIVNTMVMSITERRKEIGILKSLGAHEGDIRALFLVESGVIGLVGTAGGILCGWIFTRIVSAIAKGYMRGQGIPEMDLFSLPPWLFLMALGVGIGVSVLAGFYPAARAARVDPVEALRNE